MTAAGIGTATAVCGSEVLAFGHPMNFNGKTTMTMHGARAVTIIDDPVWGAWKMANLGSPNGVIDQDRLTAIHGVSGPAPATSDITSDVTVGSAARTGTTWISLPEAVPDISIGHVVSDQDVVLNSITEGHGTFGYTVHFTREDGTKQTMSRHDLYADPYDISYGDVWDFANLVYTLGYSGLEDVTIDSITTESDLTTTYQHYVLNKVDMWRDGAWRKLNADRVLRLKPGSLAKFRIKLTSPQLGDRTVWESVPVPSTAGNKMGTLQVFGGNSGGGYEEEGDIYYEGKASAGDNAEPTLDDLLSQLNREPHNDDVVVDMTWYNREGKQTNHKKDHVRTGDVVDGSFAMTVRGIRPKR